MEKLSREKAEELIIDDNVVKSWLEQDLKELRIYFKLSDGKNCLVKYSKKEKEKSYYLI